MKARWHHDSIDKYNEEIFKKMELLRKIHSITDGLNNDRLKQLLDFALTLDRAEKMDLKAQLEASELSEYGKQRLEELKRELGC